MNDGMNDFSCISPCVVKGKKNKDQYDEKVNTIFIFLVNSNEFSMKIINLINALLIHKL